MLILSAYRPQHRDVKFQTSVSQRLRKLFHAPEAVSAFFFVFPSSKHIQSSVRTPLCGFWQLCTIDSYWLLSYFWLKLLFGDGMKSEYECITAAGPTVEWVVCAVNCSRLKTSFNAAHSTHIRKAFIHQTCLWYSLISDLVHAWPDPHIAKK